MIFELFKRIATTIFRTMTTREMLPFKYKFIETVPTLLVLEESAANKKLAEYQYSTQTLVVYYNSLVSIKDLCFILIHTLIHHYQYLFNPKLYISAFSDMDSVNDPFAVKYEAEANYYAFIITEDVLNQHQIVTEEYKIIRFLPTTNLKF